MPEVMFAGRRGRDMRGKVVVSYEAGTLSDPVLTEDRSGEATFIYAGGQGDGEARVFTTESDAARLDDSKINRRENFFDGGTYSSVTGLGSAARRRLAQLRPGIRFSGNLVSSGKFLYGRDWFLGDEVRAWFMSKSYEMQVASVYVSMAGNGRETVRARLEYYA